MSLKFIDLFAGCGGLSLGLMQAGLKGIFAIERDRMAFETLCANLVGAQKNRSFQWPDWLPVEPIGIETFVRKYSDELRRLRGKIDLVAGGPPCQGFSFAGKRNSQDSRNSLAVRFYVETVRLVRPKYLLLENVRGITVGFNAADGSKRGSSFSLRIKRKLDKLGYDVFDDIVHAVDFGVPQRRPRFIMLGVRRRKGAPTTDPFKFLETARSGLLRKKGLPSRPITVCEALSDLEVRRNGTQSSCDTNGFQEIRYRGPKTKYQRLMRAGSDNAPPNSLRLANHRPETIQRFAALLKTARRGVVLSPREREHLGATNKHVIVVLDQARPSHTLTTLPDDILHYGEPRILTVREFARLQSFPDWFAFCGNYTTGGQRRRHEAPRYTQVGNAVPPFLAEGIGLALRLHHRSTLRVRA